MLFKSEVRLPAAGFHGGGAYAVGKKASIAPTTVSSTSVACKDGEVASDGECQIDRDRSGVPIKIKAITLYQPWASLIAMGIKRYETRSWGTNYRGPIAIHAAKKSPDEFIDSVRQNLKIAGCELENPEAENLYPTGGVVAIAQLTDCYRMTAESIASQSPVELAVGDWQVGRFAWRLEEVRTLPTPITSKGKQGLWEIEVED